MAKLAAGSAGEGLRGRVAGMVYRETAQGTVVQAMPPARRATSAKEILEGEHTAWVAGLWGRLEPEAMRRWAAYAAAAKGLDPEAGAGGTNGYLEFSALGRSIMRIDPALPIPSEPPAGRFLGDLVVVTAEGSLDHRDTSNRGFLPLGGGQGGGASALRDASDPTPTPPQREGRSIGSLSVGTETPSLPSPKGEEPVIESSSVTFTSDRANAPGVLTELLTQPLANGARRPKANGYRSRGFVAFEGPGGVAVEVGEGWHACATRFVERATGRTMALLPCGVVRAA